MLFQKGPWRSPLFAKTCLFGVFAASAFAELGDHDEWKRRVEHCQNLFDKIPRSYSARLVRQGFSGNTDNFSQTIWRFHDYRAIRTEQHRQNVNREVESKSFAAMANADYWAALGLGADGHWRIREIHTTKDTTYSSKMKDGIGDFVSGAAFPLSRGHYPDLASARKVDKLADDVNGSVSSFRFEFAENSADIFNLEYLVISFDDSKHGMIVKIFEKRRSRPFGSTIEYEEFVKFGNAFLPLLERAYLNEGGESGRKLWHEDRISLLDEKVLSNSPQFWLTYYNLPEPVSTRRGSSVWAWIVVCGLLLFAIGTALIRRHMRS